MKHETRMGQAVEVREGDDGEGIRVTGYAAVFNQETDICGFFRERILPGAFSDAIGKDDVVFLVNHHGLPLARTRSGTLKLSEDDHGLKIETELDPNDPDVQALIPKMQRGDLDKMSFAFSAVKETWDETVDPPMRSVEKAELYDVSVVTNPAYEGTEIGLRSLQTHRENLSPQRKSSAVSVSKRRMQLGLVQMEQANSK
ncbi:HK97 family phage prohead protease [Pseudovibrio sp. POLY-S9]|uniref:HK97 family phage prohead protease n=1 Tax=Pseudovibrio sp. POLY-S9 TaxID=1576596 RepID=UPI00070A6C05|nr:HK97 family phage prohead protease [Pseudovibrio sp. POLY-S9]